MEHTDSGQASMISRKHTSLACSIQRQHQKGLCTCISYPPVYDTLHGLIPHYSEFCATNAHHIDQLATARLFPPPMVTVYSIYLQIRNRQSRNEKEQARYRIDIDSIVIGKWLSSRLQLQYDKPSESLLQQDPRIHNAADVLDWQKKQQREFASAACSARSSSESDRAGTEMSQACWLLARIFRSCS